MLLIGKKKRTRGRGLVNYFIDHVPFRVKYWGNFCGPGNDFEKDVANNVKPQDRLDEKCYRHDKSYSRNKDLESRHKADEELIEGAWEIATDPKEDFARRAAAWGITNIMKLKRATGSGLSRKKSTQRLKAGKKPKARKTLKAGRKLKTRKKLHVIPLPKSGGILKYLIPLLTGLTKVGSVASKASEILEALRRMQGSGIDRKARVGKYRQGLGLFLNPYDPYR